MKLLVTDCTDEISKALDGVHEGNGSKVNDTTIGMKKKFKSVTKLLTTSK